MTCDLGRAKEHTAHYNLGVQSLQKVPQTDPTASRKMHQTKEISGETSCNKMSYDALSSNAHTRRLRNSFRQGGSLGAWGRANRQMWDTLHSPYLPRARSEPPLSSNPATRWNAPPPPLPAPGPRSPRARAPKHLPRRRAPRLRLLGDAWAHPCLNIVIFVVTRSGRWRRQRSERLYRRGGQLVQHALAIRAPRARETRAAVAGRRLRGDAAHRATRRALRGRASPRRPASQTAAAAYRQHARPALLCRRSQLFDLHAQR